MTLSEKSADALGSGERLLDRRYGGDECAISRPSLQRPLT